MTARSAYLPLTTYPECMPDAAIDAALAQAKAMGLTVEAGVFAVDIPQPVTPFGSIVLDIPDLVRRAEEKSRADAARLEAHVEGSGATVGVQRVYVGAAEDRAAAAARGHDLVILPWAKSTGRDMATAMAFGAGRPVLLVPAGAVAAAVDHVAVAWDGSRVAARALWDALSLLPEGARVTLLTVVDEKAVEDGAAATMAATLAKRGWKAGAVTLHAAGRGVAAALQEGAAATGAQVLALGAFGHSRLRDFVLGGVTTDILADCRMPVLLSH